MENTDVTRTLRDALSDVLEEARKAPPVPNTNTQHIVVHQAEPPKPSPWHAWACVTAVIVMAVMTCVLGMMFLDLSRKYDRMQDHLSAIYMMAPQLKPKD